MTPEPGAAEFIPALHCGLELAEQSVYDDSVLQGLREEVLTEVDQSIDTIESLLPRN